MRILVTNDDGIHAPGLEVAEEIARAISDDVWVIAPERDQSGVAHALTLSDPVRVREAGERRFAVLGTPTDCVIMGFKEVIGEKPDLVLSGVNRGQNIADDVTYSGTIAAAMEGTLLEIPSIALSQAYGFETRDRPYWDTARTHAPALIQAIFDDGFPNGTLININFPNCRPGDVASVAVTHQGRRVPDWLKVDRRIDGRGHPYYWIGFQRSQTEPVPGSDLAALTDNQISVTPLALDLTDRAEMNRLKDLFASD